MNKRNAGYKKSLKRLLSFMMSALFVFSLFAGSGCNKAKTIEDYPEPVTVTASVDTKEDGESENTADTSAKPAEDEEVLDEVLSPEYDSLREKGEFEFNPTAVNPLYKMEMKKNPKIIRVTKEILAAVHDAKPSFELTDELSCSEAEFKIAWALAEISSPVVYDVYYDTEDSETYTITYFPTFEYNEFNERSVTGGLSEEEAKEKIDAFKEVCEKMINETLTDKDDDMQRAAKIYKKLIETYEFRYPDFESGNIEDSEEEIVTDSFETNSFLVDQVLEGKLGAWQFLDLYEGLLVQLNVESMMVGALGQYHKQDFSLLDATMTYDSGDSSFVWTIVYYDDKAYHCDILMDKMALDSQRESFEEYESDMLYFGMSDERRQKSFTIYFTRGFETVNPVNSTSVPVCEEDYKLEL